MSWARLTKIVGLLCYAAGSALQAQAPLTAVAAQADFDVLRAALEEAHGGLHRFVSKAELDGRFAAHRAKLDRPLTRFELAGILSEAIADIRDGHLRLEYDSASAAALAGATVLPLRVILEDARLVVLFNDSPGDTVVRPGMEIMSINGRTVPQLLDALLPKVSGDGFIQTGRRTRVARTFPQLYWLFVEQAGEYVVALRDPTGRTTTATLAGIIERNRRSMPNPVNAIVAANLARRDGPAGNVSLEFLDTHALARLRVRAFDGAEFPASLDSAFRTLRERGTSALILDLRGNGGGVDEYGALLLSYFLDRPFRYFERIKVTTPAPSFATWPPRTFEAMRSGTIADSMGGYLVTAARHAGVGEWQPAAHSFRGNLIVLIDGGSFSTTADVAAHLRSRRRAVFVGEETAGTYEGNTSGLNALIVLPNSRLRLRVMMYGYWNAVQPQPGGRGILPDHAVPFRVSDVLHGIDRALEVAGNLVQ
jgi:hypothetical protein